MMIKVSWTLSFWDALDRAFDNNRYLIIVSNKVGVLHSSYSISSTPLHFKPHRCFQAIFSAPSLNCFHLFPTLRVWDGSKFVRNCVEQKKPMTHCDIFICILDFWLGMIPTISQHIDMHQPQSMHYSAISKTHRITPSNLHAKVFAQLGSGHFTLWTILLQAVPQSQFHDLSSGVRVWHASKSIRF